MKKLKTDIFLEQINASMKLLAIVMILIVLFKPVFTSVLQALNDDQNISLSEGFENDSEKDDSEEEETEKESDDKIEEINFLEVVNGLVFISKSTVASIYSGHWSEYKHGIITPPPKFS
ncbi:MAG: flagellar biosynthesis/type III secretory pathway M-ring protein FliF/YscJ [Salibacteraceae bacterium]|jgi:flagellar biosynthesis/type III secretory pathway M-ring protein FliF/YscJ